MSEIKGFLKFKRRYPEYRPVCERIKDYSEVAVLPTEAASQEQASRCMDCGTPFCHWGCPVGNYIPEWNDFMQQGKWQKAIELLEATNNLPEITGRLCPAPCEYSCVLGINDDPVTIRENELAIIEQAFEDGLIRPQIPQRRTGKKIAIVGSGPAGISCAAQLNQSGHKVVVLEKDDKIGGLLRYGIPDFKLEKWVLDRRIGFLEKEGIRFITGTNVGVDLRPAKLKREFDAICLVGGCRVPRDLNIEGRNLKGIHFALDYLSQANKRVSGEIIPEDEAIDAKGKRVVVLGGGDTGADCLGVAHRQGAGCVVQIELLPQPPDCRNESMGWPRYPMLLKTSSSHQEGGERQWSIATKKFLGQAGLVKKLSCIRVEFSDRDTKSCPIMREIHGTEFEIEADLVILALGFIRPEKQGLVDDLRLELDGRGNVMTNGKFMTSRKGVFSAGDMHRGQSLIVWAISEGRRCAYAIDEYLTAKGSLLII